MNLFPCTLDHIGRARGAFHLVLTLVVLVHNRDSLRRAPFVNVLERR